MVLILYKSKASIISSNVLRNLDYAWKQLNYSFKSDREY